MARRGAQRAGASPRVLSDDLMRSRLRLLGVVLVCLKVALLPLVFDTLADRPFTVGKALTSHALAYALAGVMIGLLVQFGSRLVVRSWLHVPVLAFFAANVMAALFAADTTLALFGAHTRMLGLGTIADMVILYFAVVFLVRTRRESIAVIATALASSAVVLVYAFAQLAHRDPFDWNQDTSLRPFSTLGQTTTLAEYLVVIAIGAGALALFEGSLRRAFRIALLAFAIALLAGVVITQTRAAVLGLVAGTALLVVLTWRAHPNRRARLASLIGGTATTAALVVVLLFTPLGARVLGTVELSAAAESDDPSGPRLEQSADVRVALYRISLEMLRDRPILGYGPDNLSAGLPLYRSESEPFEVQQSLATSAHGWPAQIAATNGVAGLAAFVAIAGMALFMTFRSGFRPAAWVGAAMLVAFLGAGLTTVNEMGTEWLFWTSTGLVAIATTAPQSALPPETRADRRARRATQSGGSSGLTGRGWLAIACAVVGLALMLTTLNAFDASRSSRSSTISRFAGRYPQAIDFALRATRADPGRAEYWEGLGLSYVGAERLADGAVAFSRAVAIAPYEVRYLGDLARAYAVMFQRGDASAAQRARDAADLGVAKDPNNPLPHQTRAVVMQVTNDLPEALKSVERALKLDQSNNREIYLTQTQILESLRRPADAVAAARYGLTRIPDPRNQVALRLELARALFANGQKAEALTELDALLAIQPNQTAALQLRAQIQATP